MSSLVLIADDDIVSREELQSVLQRGDYRFETAENGREAIEKARELSPDLILLDVMMPEYDGFEVCQAIRAMPEIAEVPIIILTALDDRESFMRGLEAGADDFLSKPFNRHELRARVKTITRLNRYRRLQEERARIRELTSQMINLQENERRGIAQELHDEVGQWLTMLSIGLKLIDDDLTADQAQARARVVEMLEITQKTISQLRLMGHELRPQALDVVGLGPTLEGYCRDFSRRTELPVRFSIEGQVPALSSEYNITAYRFLQEALTNILKHASASQVWVRLSATDEAVTLSVRDDGRGFPKTKEGVAAITVNREDGSPGMGLLGMQERLALLNGRLEITSQPGQGSRVTAWLPLHNTGTQ